MFWSQPIFDIETNSSHLPAHSSAVRVIHREGAKSPSTSVVVHICRTKSTALFDSTGFKDANIDRATLNRTLLFRDPKDFPPSARPYCMVYFDGSARYSSMGTWWVCRRPILYLFQYSTYTGSNRGTSSSGIALSIGWTIVFVAILVFARGSRSSRCYRRHTH